jgi:hypothetical protein
MQSPKKYPKTANNAENKPLMIFCFINKNVV